MRLSRILTIITLLGAPATGWSQGFDGFVAKLAAEPAGAARRFSSCDVLIAPNGEVRRPCTLALADLGAGPGATLRARRVKLHPFPRSTWSWLEADVDLVAGGTKAAFHVVEIGQLGNPDAPDQGWSTLAAVWSRVGGGEAASPAAIVDQVVPEPAGLNEEERGDREGSISAVKGELAEVAKLEQRLRAWAAHGAVIVTAEGKTFAGKKGASWLRGSKLALERKGGTLAGGRPTLGWGVARIDGSPRDKASPVAFTALVVFTQHMTPGGGALESEPALVHLMIPRQVVPPPVQRR